MAKSYNFLFHKNDVTWRLSVNGLLLLLKRLITSRRGVIRGLIIFMLWLKFFCFQHIIIYYHTQKQRKIKCKPRTKSYHNLYYCDWSTNVIDLQLMIVIFCDFFLCDFFVINTPFIACWDSFLISGVFAGYYFLII